jgi:N-acetylglucosamine-6-phosphate deacetylase
VKKITPGNKPASVIPKKNRAIKSPADEVTAAMQTMTIPQAIITIGIHFEGPTFLSIKLDGTSNNTCGTS